MPHAQPLAKGRQLNFITVGAQLSLPAGNHQDTYSRVLAPGLCALDLGLPEVVIERNELSTAWRCFDRVLDAFIQRQLIAA
jgi:hypothetical protein